MPVYKSTRAKLAGTVANIEKKGEQVVTVVDDEADNLLVISRAPEETTGRAWLPSSAKETRA